MKQQILKLEQLKPILLKNWYLCFKLEKRDDGKIAKVPYSPNGNYRIGSTYIHEFRTATQAAEAVNKYNYSGIGIAFIKDTPLAGIDIDKCIDEQGNIAPLAAEIVAAMDSYTEYSPSKKGLHILFFADGLQLKWNKVKPEGQKLEEVEIYTEGRYFTLTGDIYGQAKAVAERKEQAEKVISMLDKWAAKETTTTAPTNPSINKPSLLSDNEILEKAFKAQNGDKVKRLYNGDSGDYGNDASRGDMALCEVLLINAGMDTAAVDRIFRTSGRMRNKWDEIHDRKNNRTYGEITMDKAYSTATANYVSPEAYKAKKQEAERREQKAMDDTIAKHFKDNGGTVFYDGGAIEAAQVPSGETLFIARDKAIAEALVKLGQYVLLAKVDKTADIKNLMGYLKQQQPVCNVIFTYDEYKVGKAYKTLKDDELAYIAANLSPTVKHPITQEDITYLNSLIDAPDNSLAYIRLSMRADMERYRAAAKNTTGFKELDKVLGGLDEGVYTMGGEAGTGKTTFYWQIAENIASTGRPIIYFSIELPRPKIITKSIARRLYTTHLINSSPTANEIRECTYDKSIDAEVQKAWDDYCRTVKNNVNIVEGSMINCTAGWIRKYIERYIERTQKRPVVFIDYLQVLKSGNPKDGERESIIACYNEIKDLSKSEHLTIFLISSLNRQSYYTDISKEAMMGSGSIEYTSDAVMALQLNCITADSIFSSTGSSGATLALKKKVHREAVGAKVRLIKLSIIKSRNSGTGNSVLFEYVPRSDYFETVGWEDYKGIKHFRDGYTRQEQWQDIIREPNKGKGTKASTEEAEEEPEEEQSFIYKNKDTDEVTRDKKKANKWKKEGFTVDQIPAIISNKALPPDWVKN